MKKLLLTLFGLTVLAASVSGQSENKRIWGIRAGLNVANIHSSGADEILAPEAGSRTSFHLGLSLQLPIDKERPFYLESGLLLSSKGTKFNLEKEMGTPAEAKVVPVYLEIPLVFSYHFQANDVSIQPYAGFYVGLGVHGKIKAKITYQGTTESGKADIFKDSWLDTGNNSVKVPQELKRGDIGYRLGLGIAIAQHYYIGLGYEASILNIAKDTDNSKMKNGNFFISTGYNF